jgi:hypothetical protein
LSGSVVGILSAPLGIDSSLNSKTDGHTSGTEDKWRLAANTIQDESDEDTSHDYTQSTVDTRDEKDGRSAQTEGSIDCENEYECTIREDRECYLR